MAGLDGILSWTDALISVTEPIISFVETIKSRKDACFSAAEAILYITDKTASATVTGSSVVASVAFLIKTTKARGTAVIDRRYSITAGRRWRQGQP